MGQKLVIAGMPVAGEEKRVTALFENEEAVELYVSGMDETGLLNNIYLGHVTKVHAASNGAFVRFDGMQEGFLPLGRMRNPLFKTSKKTAELRPEDELLVRVENEAVKTKLPGLSTELVITGKYLVASSGFSGLHFSKKLSDADRDRLFGWLADAENPFGFIVRTAAAAAPENEIRREAASLAGELSDICRFGISRPAGTCLYRPAGIWIEKFRKLDFSEADTGVVTDDLLVYEELIRECQREEAGTADLQKRIRLYADPMLALYRLYRISSVMDKALSEKVWLKSGAFLVIEQTEAFVCIDVNSGKTDRKAEREALFYEINREAAKEAARQIRLRQLSGTILIDFINMKSKESEKRLKEEMERLTSRDSSAVNVVDITPLGIMELTRKKRGRSLAEQVNG